MTAIEMPKVGEHFDVRHPCAAHCQVLLNGEDVSKRCVAGEVGPTGWVVVYKLDERGKIRVSGGSLEYLKLTGDVKVIAS